MEAVGGFDSFVSHRLHSVAMTPPVLVDQDTPPLDDALHAIAEARRREILRLVWSQELSAGQIAAHFPVTRPAISQHLTVLRGAGLIAERREGTKRLYRARPEQVGGLLEALDRFWSEGLERLKHEAEAEQAEAAQANAEQAAQATPPKAHTPRGDAHGR